MIANLLLLSLCMQRWQHFFHTKYISWREEKIREIHLSILRRIYKNIVLNAWQSERQNIFFYRPHTMHIFQLFHVPVWKKLCDIFLRIQKKVISFSFLLAVRVLICSKTTKKDPKNFSAPLKKFSYFIEYKNPLAISKDSTSKTDIYTE